MKAELFFFKTYFKTLGLIFWPWKVEIQKCSSCYLKLVERLVKNNGEKWTILYLKNLYSYTSSFLLRSQKDELKPSGPISLYNTGWPRCLKGFPQLINNKDSHIPRVIINSILRSYLIFILDPEWKSQSITSPFTGRNLETADMYNSIGKSLEFLNIKRVSLESIQHSFSGWHLSKKAGPNGGQATQTWFRDLIALLHPREWILYNNLLKLGYILDPEGKVTNFLNLRFLKHDYIYKRYITHAKQYFSYTFLVWIQGLLSRIVYARTSLTGVIRFNGYFSIYFPLYIFFIILGYIPFVLKSFSFLLNLVTSASSHIVQSDQNHPDFIWGFRFWKRIKENTGKTKEVRIKDKKTNKVLKKKINITKEVDVTYKTGLFLKTARFCMLPEHGGKTRIIVIGDIFSQSLLKPFHEKVFSILRSLFTDGTHDQDRQCERIRNFSQRGLNIYSFDLKDCTDRFPVSFQRQVVSKIFGWKLGGLWEAVICDRWISDPHGSSFLRYEVGQPMGLLSSWAVMALSHHVVVGICANKCGLKSFIDYSIVGDDIVIANDLVAIEYRDFMTNVLGVEISKPKTIIAKNAAEFCKRLYYNGYDCSPLPPMLVRSIMTQPRIISLLRSFVEDRYNWINHPSHYFGVLQKRHWKLARYMLTCPLWFSSSVFLWKMFTKENLWALVQQIKSQQSVKTPSEVSSKATSDLVSWNRKYKYALDLGYETPPGRAWARIVDPLLLGSNKKEPLIVWAGEGFITHNLHKEGWSHVCTPLDLHSNFLEVERIELNKDEVLKLSRSLSSLIKQKKLDMFEGDDDVYWYFTSTMYSGRLRSK